MLMEPTTRPSLILRLRDRDDEAAWAEFAEMYGPLIHRVARQKGLQDADASDLCQDVFQAVASAIERWDPNPAKGRFRAWLFRIVRNIMVNFFDAKRRHPHGSGRTSIQELLDAVPAGDSEIESCFTDEYKRRVFQWASARVKGEFTEATWQAFWATGVENCPVSDVAARLGISAGAVYVARSRVLNRLRNRVEQLLSDTGLDWEKQGDGFVHGQL
jgi:RNA polymerase sigma factor (sigma-70 family)